MLENKESITAKLCAYVRAYHSYYNRNKVFDDYLAFDLLGYDEYENIRNMIMKSLKDKDENAGEHIQWNVELDKNISPIPLSRIKYTEDKLLHFARENGRCQCIICGAGFDSFAFRNVNPDIEIFELDHPNTQEYKMRRIKELEWIVPKNVHFVPINFDNKSMDQILPEAGFDPNIKTFVEILGVFYYLSFATVKKTFESIEKIAAPGSMIVFDYPDDTSWKDAKLPKRVKNIKTVAESLGEKMTDGFSYEELNKALKEYGFAIVDYLSPVHIQKKYFEKRTDNLKAFENVHFIAAEYKEKNGNQY